MRLLEELIRDVVIPGEAISTTLTINSSPEVYTLLEERGDGGQGILYKAQRGDGQIVAVKILDRNPKVNEQERFAFWQKLDDVVGVTHLLAHGISSLELRKYAVVSDYVDGLNLEQLRARTPLSEEVVREILFQSATILGNIHAQNVLHRDIKPSNIMIDRSGAVYVTDFGAARNADVHTMTATMLGTPSYMAPEQDQKPSPRSDLYSLGLTVYFAMKGEHPPLMPGLEYSRSLYFGELEGDYSPELLSLVKKMCEHDPEKRHQNAGEVLRDLEGRVDEIAVVDDNKIATLREEIRMYEERVKSIRNFTLAGGALVVAGTALAMLGAPYEATPVGIVAMYLGSFSALVGFATGVSYGFFYGPQRKKLQGLKERLQLEGRTTTPVLVPEKTSNAISDLEKRVRVTRNIAFGSLAAIVGGSALAAVGAQYGETPAGIVPIYLGTVSALSGLVGYGIFGYLNWRQRKELQDLKERLQLEGRTTTPVLVPDVVVLSTEDVEKKRCLETEIASLETQIADFRWYNPPLAIITLPFTVLFHPVKGLVADHVEGDFMDDVMPLIADIESPYHYFQAKKRLSKAKNELELLVEGNPEVRDLLVKKQDLDKPLPFWRDVTQHSFSIPTTVVAAYGVYSGANIGQLVLNATIAAGIYVGEKMSFDGIKRRHRKALDDKITALRQPQLPAPPPERSYILMPTTSTYGYNVHALQEACIAEQNPLHPKYRLANGKEVYRSLTFKETFQAGVEDFWRLKDANGRDRTIDERVALLRASKFSCTGIAYQKHFFTIIPECTELIDIQKDFVDAFIRREYATLRTQGIELDRTKAEYNTPLTSGEIDHHEAWLTALQGDATLLKAGREAGFAAHQQQYGVPLERGMGFYLCNSPTQDTLLALCLTNRGGGDPNLFCNGDLISKSSFVRIAPHRNF